MYCWLNAWPCDVHYFSSVSDRRHTQTIPRSHRRSCHDASCEIDYNKHHDWHGKWEPLRLTATWISNYWCVCVCVLKGAIMRRTGYHWRAQTGCQFSYCVVVFAFTVYDDRQITKMFKWIFLVWNESACKCVSCWLNSEFLRRHAKFTGQSSWICNTDFIAFSTLIAEPTSIIFKGDICQIIDF